MNSRFFLAAGLLLAISLPSAAQPASPCNCSGRGLDVMPASETAKILNDIQTPVSRMSIPALRPSPDFQEELVVRNVSGQVETHANWIYHIVVLEGEATLTAGGTVEGNKDTGPGEQRGDSSTGGVAQKIQAHSVIDIAAGMPNWITLAPGGHIAYLVFMEKS